MTKAFTYENPVTVQVVGYMGIVYNTLWGFLFWQEIPDWTTVLGGILIVGACIALSWQKTVAARSKTA